MEDKERFCWHFKVQTVVAPCCAHLTVHESLKLQLSNAKLAVLLGQTPAGLGKADLGSPHHTHILWRLTQLQLVCPLQLEVLKTPDGKRRCWFFLESCAISSASDASECWCETWWECWALHSSSACRSSPGLAGSAALYWSPSVHHRLVPPVGPERW